MIRLALAVIAVAALSPAQDGKDEKADKNEVVRKMAAALDAAYGAFDAKEYERCIKFCDGVLLADAQYSVAVELKTDVAKARHRAAYHAFLVKKVAGWRELEGVLPYADTVKLPSAADWKGIAAKIDALLSSPEELLKKIEAMSRRIADLEKEVAELKKQIKK